MTRMHALVIGGLVGCLAVGSLVYAQANRMPVLTAQDYTEITELYARLYQGSDLRELDLWLSTFADDGAFVFPNGDEVAGKDALAAWRANSFGGSVADSKRRHWTSSVMLTPTPEGAAKARAYYMVVDVSQKQAVVASTGSFDDLFVKTAAGWRFKTHKVISDARAD